MSKIVKKSLFRKSLLMVPAALVLLGSASSCNEKTKETEEIAVTVSTVAVKTFSLKADSKVLSNLDSVFFSIDLDKGVIFNADSLPVGTDISRLIPVVTFMTTMSKADIVVSEEGGEDKTYDYLKNANDSIDFTKKVQLKVTAYDQESSYTYDLKVNVHKQKPDSLMWDKMAVATLPSRKPSPEAQHSLLYKDKALSIIEESDGQFTLATSSDLFKGSWDKQSLTLNFSPDLSSLTATPDALWMLGIDGSLFTSADGIAWSDTGEKWATLIGPYLDCVLGVKSSDSGLVHCHYPDIAEIADPETDPEFPMSGRSAFVTIDSEWSELPTAFFVGGLKSDMLLSDATWAFDGTIWAKIDDIPAPAVESPTIVNYVYNRRTSDIFHSYYADAWLLFGGRMADGNMNDTVYYSYDNGITWRPGSSLMQLPDYVPALYRADGIVMSSPLTADITDYWTSTPSSRAGLWLKPEYTIDGYDITWQCPYVYLIGGCTSGNLLSDTIWRGVLARLAFTPLF